MVKSESLTGDSMWDTGKRLFFAIAPLWLTAFIVSCQLFIVAPLLPLIQHELLNTILPSDFALGFLGTAYSISLACSTLVVGPISDRVGRRMVLIVGTALIAAALLLHGIAKHYESLLIMRALAGAAAGVYSGSMVAFVGDYFPYKRRGWATGWIMTGVACGQIIGTPAGILLANTYGFQMPFIVFGGLMVLASGMIWRYLPKPNVSYDEKHISMTAILKTYGGLLRSQGPSAGVLLYFLLFASIGFFLFFFPKWLEADIGISVQQLALLFVMGGVGIVVGTTSGGMLSDRFGRKPIIVCASFVMILVLPFVTLWVQGLTSAIIVTVLILLPGAMRTGPIMALLTTLTTDTQRGSMMGLVTAAGQFGLGMATATAGWLYEYQGFLYNILASTIAIVLMIWVVWQFLPEPQ